MPVLPKKSNQRDLFPGALEMMILRSVSLRPMHGYALVQHIKQRSNDLASISTQPIPSVGQTAHLHARAHTV